MTSKNPYQVLGASPPPMQGRKAIMRRIDGHLPPDHVSLIGPAYYGKSVLLRHLYQTYRKGLRRTDGWLTTAHIDLRRRIPSSDQEFILRFAQEVRKELMIAHRSDLAERIEFEMDSVYEDIEDVFDDLEQEETRLLVVLDGFDYVLASTGLTRDLWDRLRALAQKNSLRLVTGSRQPLQALCKTEESQTSDFWAIFYEIRVTAFERDDVEVFLQPLEDRGGLDDSAREEITNWTGRVPVLLCELLRRLWADHPGSPLAKLAVDQAAEGMLAERQQLLDALWDDCDDELRLRLGTLSDGDLSATDKFRHELTERGLGHVENKRLHSSCRLMERYAKAREPAISYLQRRLREPSGFETHVRSVLDLRLSQVSQGAVDGKLCDYVRWAIRDLAPTPEIALGWIRKIANRALHLIWAAELPPDGAVPSEWRQAGVVPDGRGEMPRSAGQQVGILRLISGSAHARRQCRYVTKTTSLLVDHLHSVGNFGQHDSDYPEVTVSFGFAASVVLSAISLIECLGHDLAGAGRPDEPSAAPGGRAAGSAAGPHALTLPPAPQER